MKKLFLFLAFSLATLLSYSQNCIEVVNATLTNPSNNNTSWKLTIDWTSSGTKHLLIKVLVGNDTVINTCHQSQGQNRTGTLVYDINSPNGLSAIRVILDRNTGTCNNGTSCGSTVTITNGVLPLKISELSARNVGVYTNITFKVLSLDKVNSLKVNYVMEDGTKKYFDITLPNTIREGQYMTISINNKTGNYTIK
jgi:hypothetical protein